MANLDTTRDFLEVIVDPQEHGVETRLDIVAVHGLNPSSSHSNAETTWTTDTKDGPKFWLKDSTFLPSKVPNARILLFGYNSNPSFASSNAGLSQQAKSLLLKIRYERHDCPRRPLLFICHSLGGLLVKRALVIAHGNTIDLPTFEACHGIVFFGTPHGGGNKASLGDIAFNIARVIWGKKEQNSFMEALKGNSFFAEDHRDDFLQLSNNFQFISFYESNKLKGLHQVVRREDAVLNLPDMKEDKIPLDADHSQMCRFLDPNGRDYRAVWLPIKIMAENAIKQSKETINEFFELRFSEPEHFRGRNAIIETLHHCLSFADDSTKLYALQGPAGIGKSAIAIQYAHCFRQDYHGVFMISAESKASLERDFRDIEIKMGVRVNKSFRQWCTESHGKASKRWLVVIDNWEDPSVFNPREHIPRSAGGCVLITCRRKDISCMANIIAVPPLPEKSATTFLLKVSTGRRESARDRHYARKIATALEFNPLAIKQCGRFVGETEGNLAEYPSSLDELMVRIQPALEDSCDDIFRFDREEKSILTTWEVSFQHLEKHDREASTLLALFGFLDPSSIRELIIEAGLKTQRRWTNDGGVADTWLECSPSEILWLAKTCERRGVRKIMQKLSNFSFLFERPQKGRYYMNGLTHYWLSHRQRDSGASSLRNAAYLLANGYPHPDFAVNFGWNLQIQSLFFSYKMHLKQMEKAYEDDDMDLDLETLQSLATVFLYDREMRIRFAHKGGDFLWQGDEDHASYFELVESIVRRSHSPSLWLHAMVAYFDLHFGIQTIKGKDMYTYLAEYEYAGTNWHKVNETLRAQDPGGPPKHKILRVDDVGIPQERMEGDNLSWTGLVVDTDILDPIGPSASSDPTIGLCNGYMGLFVILLIQSWRRNLGKRMYYKVLDQPSVFVETRDGSPLVEAWLNSEKLTSPILKYVSSLLRDILTEGWGKRIIAAFEETEGEILHDKPDHATIEARVQEHVKKGNLTNETSNYVSFFQSNIQPLINYLGIENLITMKKLKSHLALCTRLGLDDFLAELSRHLLQSIPLTSQNVFSFTVLLGEVIGGSQDWIEPTLEEWVQKMTDLDRTSKIPRIYANDPLLDVLELIILFHQRSGGDQEKTASWKRTYHAVALQRYPDLTSQLCLGFGIGAFGLPYSRLRTHNYPVGEDPSYMPWVVEEARQPSEADLAKTQNLVAKTKTWYQQYIDKAWALPTNEGRTVAVAELLCHFQRSVGIMNDDTPQYWALLMGAEERDGAAVGGGGAGARVEDEGQGKGEGDTQEQESQFGKEALGNFLRQSNITIGELATIIRQMPVSDDAAPAVHIGPDDESVSESEDDEDDEEPLSVDVSELSLDTS